MFYNSLFSFFHTDKIIIKLITEITVTDRKDKIITPRIVNFLTRFVKLYKVDGNDGIFLHSIRFGAIDHKRVPLLNMLQLFINIFIGNRYIGNRYGKTFNIYRSNVRPHIVYNRKRHIGIQFKIGCTVNRRL